MSVQRVINGEATWAIDNVDVLAGLRSLPDNCVHCCVTSPPYWGLRDYGCDGQIGLEKTPAEFVARMVEVFEEVRRVLRPDGTCWMNMGDSYAGSWGAQSRKGDEGGTHGRQIASHPKRTNTGSVAHLPGLKPKDLCGVPWMLAFALRDSGWYLRSEVIWHKRSPMPESVRDRPTKAHEQIFLLTKSQKYFYDAFAGSERSVGGQPGNTNPHSARGGLAEQHRTKANLAAMVAVDRRNARSVWTFSNESFKGAHFATYPTRLVKKCLLLGTSAKGCCSSCNAPWRRIVKKQRVATRSGEASKVNRASAQSDSPYEAQAGIVVGNRDPQRHVTKTKTVGWEPSCECGLPDTDTVRCIVLDPFAGAGTTPMVARRLDLRAIGFELNPDYAAMARQRIADDAPLFNTKET